MLQAWHMRAESLLLGHEPSGGMAHAAGKTLSWPPLGTWCERPERGWISQELESYTEYPHPESPGSPLRLWS